MYNRTKGILYIIGCAVTGILMAGSVDALASYPKGYYNSLNGKCGAELVTALKNLAKGHKVISYGDATWRAFKSTAVKTVNGIESWWDM